MCYILKRAGMREEKTIILTVRVDYCTDGRDELDAITAARMVVRDNFPTIDNGVEISRVEVFGNDGELFVADALDADPPRLYDVETDKQEGTTTIWETAAGVGLRFRHGDTLARYNSELIARRPEDYTGTEQGLEQLERIRERLTGYAARRFPYNFGELNTNPIS